MYDLGNLMAPQATGLYSLELLLMSILILVASIIRGYSGFGFSAIVVAAASLFTATREVVPLVLLLEIVASIQMAAQVWRFVNWKMVLAILGGSVISIPVGQRVLLWIDVEPMRIVAAVLMLTAVVLRAGGISFPFPNAPRGWFGIGIISGFMNGLLAMGGMWVMIFLIGSGINVATLRASLVALFFTTDCYAALVGAGQGLIHTTILARFIWSLPALFLGVWIGSRKFAGSKAETYRRVVLSILAGLALLLLAKALV